MKKENCCRTEDPLGKSPGSEEISIRKADTWGSSLQMTLSFEPFGDSPGNLGLSWSNDAYHALREMSSKVTSGQTLRDDCHGESVQRPAMQLSKAKCAVETLQALPLFLTIAQMTQTRVLGLWDCVKRNC